MKIENRKIALSLWGLSAVFAVAVAGCSGDGDSSDGGTGNIGGRPSAFVLTNLASDNRVVAFTRGADGSLTQAGTISTRGQGSGSPLDSQGALILSPDRNRLYASNPGSDEITVFSVQGNGVNFVQKVPSDGDLPLSLTMHGSTLYVLNSGTGSSISGFTVGADGRLTLIPNSKRMLSTAIGSPAQIQFNPTGDTLVVTQKATSVFDTYVVGSDGRAAGPTQHPSNGVRPFGFAFRSDGTMIVSESFNVEPNQGAASSYSVAPGGAMSLISGSVKNNQTDGCWIAISNDGRFAYETNFISGTISSYSVGSGGALTLLAGEAATTGANSQPEDMAISTDGQFLHVLLTGTGRMGVYRIENDGRLTAMPGSGGIPAMAGATGLAAR